MKNQAVVKHLEMIAHLRALNGDNQFSVNAFSNAAKSIASLGVSINDFDVMTMPGIGIGIATEIKDFLRTGTTIRYQHLFKKFPVEMLSMTIVRGVGAKRAALLYQKGYHNFEQLHQAALANKLDEKLTEAVLSAASKSTDRINYEIALPIAQELYTVLNNLNFGKVEIAGSLRRKMPTIKDIDLVMCVEDTSQKSKIVEKFFSLGINPAGAESKYSIKIIRPNCQLQVDLWLGEPAYWGTLLNHTTGSKEHNIAIRMLAKSKGMTISEYGVFQNGQRIGGAQETDLYQILNLSYVEPQKRTGILPT